MDLRTYHQVKKHLEGERDRMVHAMIIGIVALLAVLFIPSFFGMINSVLGYVTMGGIVFILFFTMYQQEKGPDTALRTLEKRFHGYVHTLEDSDVICEVENLRKCDDCGQDPFKVTRCPARKSGFHRIELM